MTGWFALHLNKTANTAMGFRISLSFSVVNLGNGFADCRR
jgi:hypothetical protein